jgi:ADP-ribosyl-[dinitrogen reductase] hydrolase
MDQPCLKIAPCDHETDALDPSLSSLREKMLEHVFLADLSRALWRQGRRDFEILRAEVDRGGYDVVVECGGVTRHIQLKSTHRNGKAREVPIQLALGSKPSGCVVWLMYDPMTMELGPFYWFGGAPGELLPDLGGKVVRHTKGNKDGVKAERRGLRMLPRNRFVRLETVDELALILFRTAAAPSTREADGVDEGQRGGQDARPATCPEDAVDMLLNPATRLWAGLCLQAASDSGSEADIAPGSVLDQATGMLLGLAVGDALGATLEFSERDEKPRLTQMIGGGPFDLKPGEWTDDTAMALALADSLLSCRGFDAGDLMERFVSWWKDGRYSCTGECFDIGTTTREALIRFHEMGDPCAGLAEENLAGNGSLMRLAPVVLFAGAERQLAVELARQQSLPTHAAPQAVEACAYLALLLCEAIGGYGMDVLRPRPWEGHPAIEAIAGGAWRCKPRAAIRSTGYVVDTLEAALWCVERTTSFEDALVLAVNLGGDSDTVGAVTGQLAGAVYGASSIPGSWLARLAWRERIEDTALALCRKGAA